MAIVILSVWKINILQLISNKTSIELIKLFLTWNIVQYLFYITTGSKSLANICGISCSLLVRYSVFCFRLNTRLPGASIQAYLSLPAQLMWPLQPRSIILLGSHTSSNILHHRAMAVSPQSYRQNPFHPSFFTTVTLFYSLKTIGSELQNFLSYSCRFSQTNIHNICFRFKIRSVWR